MSMVNSKKIPQTTPSKPTNPKLQTKIHQKNPITTPKKPKLPSPPKNPQNTTSHLQHLQAQHPQLPSRKVHRDIEDTGGPQLQAEKNMSEPSISYPEKQPARSLSKETEAAEPNMSLSTPGTFILTPLMFGHKVALRKTTAGALARRA